ncbi:MAG: hypothetical protein PHT34_05785, partial [Oscillospiraceae bacterium]|nr:hypothetical protein [Oscillospiraceae bacterium]
IRSPWDPVRRVYVILYDQEAGRNLLKQVLSGSGLLQTMDGQIALVDTQLNIQNQFAEETGVVEIPKTFGDRVTEWESRTHMPWWVSLIFALLIIAGLVALLRLRRVKNEFEQAGKVMKAEQGFLGQGPADAEKDEVDQERNP